MSIDETNEKKLQDSEWMVRPCGLYKSEYSDCVSIRARLHQYFVFGETVDCTPWKKDHMNCLKWEEEKNMKSFNEIVESEKIRRQTRLAGHYANDVWSKRKNPPPDWNRPLPEHIRKEYEHTYLALKRQEWQDIEDGKISDLHKRTLCVIS